MLDLALFRCVLQIEVCEPLMYVNKNVHMLKPGKGDLGLKVPGI